MQYPKYHKELIKMLTKDQNEVKAYSRDYDNLSETERTHRLEKLNNNSRSRADKVMNILEDIKLPTVGAIGIDGSEALAVIALHSTLSVMKRALQAYVMAYSEDSESIYSEAIPTLTDRIRIIENKNQLYGTQWLQGEDGLPFLYQLDNIDKANVRRKKFGLDTIKTPLDLSKSLVGQEKLLAKASDQRKPTKKEYDEFVKPYLD